MSVRINATVNSSPASSFSNYLLNITTPSSSESLNLKSAFETAESDLLDSSNFGSALYRSVYTASTSPGSGTENGGGAITTIGESESASDSKGGGGLSSTGENIALLILLPLVAIAIAFGLIKKKRINNKGVQ